MAEVLCDFVIHIIDIFLLQIGWLALNFILSWLMLLEELSLLDSFDKLLFDFLFLHLDELLLK